MAREYDHNACILVHLLMPTVALVSEGFQLTAAIGILWKNKIIDRSLLVKFLDALEQNDLRSNAQGAFSINSSSKCLIVS